jgi:hypothetical protein
MLTPEFELEEEPVVVEPFEDFFEPHPAASAATATTAEATRTSRRYFFMGDDSFLRRALITFTFLI